MFDLYVCKPTWKLKRFRFFPETFPLISGVFSDLIPESFWKKGGKTPETDHKIFRKKAESFKF